MLNNRQNKIRRSLGEKLESYVVSLLEYWLEVKAFDLRKGIPIVTILSKPFISDYIIQCSFFILGYAILIKEYDQIRFYRVL